jgi:hypothetical protein
MRITIEPWNRFRRFVKGNPQTLMKVKPGVAVVGKRTDSNSRIAGVAGGRDRFSEKASGLVFVAEDPDRSAKGWLRLNDNQPMYTDEKRQQPVA